VFSQLFQRPGGLVLGLGEQVSRRGWACDELAGQPERELQGDELLLGAVVQVALDPPSFGIGRLGQPGPRCLQLGTLGAQLGGEALVVQ
jgi:hypothetical protein